MTSWQRETLERRLAANAAAVARVFDTHSAADLARRPGPRAWSADECLDHLNLSAAVMLPRLAAAVADLERRTGTRQNLPSSMDWLGRLLRWSLDPPVRLRMPTSSPFEPRERATPQALVSTFLRHRHTLLEIVRSAEGLPLGAAKIVSPFDSRVRYNVFSAFHIIETHERRHLWQAERALRAATHRATDR